jgi:PD-(D/E)XK nuclease superfamily protein
LSVLTTDQKGIVAEMKIAAVALAAGVGVAQPMGPERYDLIFDLGHTVIRVQCKWAFRLGEVVVIRPRRVRRGPNGFIHRPYLPGEIDAIVGYCAETEGCYYLPSELSVERTAVQLRLAPTKNNQASRINWARDFELGATLARLQGPIAQLGERLRGTQKVAGSSPAGSTLGAA